MPQRSYICAEVIVNDIWDELTFNWDHTGIHLPPVNDWTIEKQGSKNVVIKGSNDRRQLTIVLAAILTGCFKYPQILYEGKTNRFYPAVTFPEDWDVSHTSNHWSHEVSMIQYLNKIVIPFLKSKQDALKLAQCQPAVTIFDVFKGQQTDKFFVMSQQHSNGSGSN